MILREASRGRLVTKRITRGTLKSASRLRRNAWTAASSKTAPGSGSMCAHSDSPIDPPDHHVVLAVTEKKIIVLVEIAEVTDGNEPVALDLPALLRQTVIGKVRHALDLQA
jgi:hypothetical protein